MIVIDILSPKLSWDKFIILSFNCSYIVPSVLNSPFIQPNIVGLGVCPMRLVVTNLRLHH